MKNENIKNYIVKLCNDILISHDKYSATKNVINTIYNMDISDSDKKYLIDEILKILSSTLVHSKSLYEKENQSYLTLLDMVSKELENKTKGGK